MLLENNSQKICQTSQKHQNAKGGGFWKPLNILLLLFILSLPFDVFALLRLISWISNYYSTVNRETTYYPTSIPWINDSVSCEKSGRFWENDKCWDSEHSVLF